MKALVCRVATLGESRIRAMHELFARYYADVTFDLFASDLRSKDRVVLVVDRDASIIGFSTLAIRQFDIEGRAVRIVFSGDTIIDHHYWGSQVFAFEWIREISRIKAEAPGMPLYWLLISKGYRTYRYLDAFALAFTPDWRGARHPQLDAIRNEVATWMFGENYDPVRGIVSWPEPRGRLAPQWTILSERERVRPDVKFFLDRNPGFARGDELVCLCPLEQENMKPLTRRVFCRELDQCTAGVS